ncbi:hypothetical protein MNBD_CHLOROFLEXI01-4268 [hydrothermal vent metagenome]|uniref:Uncharacterized protein n=1 Tax=hydrothermal vent metagenome TaxID=652676 RepID=A0A3B0V171_9ZZZZ
MALLNKAEIVQALKRLGELALLNDDPIELVAVGGAVMVLAYNVRPMTHDVDVMVISPPTVKNVRMLVEQVAEELSWPDDWLNDGAKGYLVGLSEGPVIFAAPGIVIKRPSVAQLLAMKLSAWRDDVDIADASFLLQELSGNQDALWESIIPYLVPGNELKAQYAFLDLWETIYGDS